MWKDRRNGSEGNTKSQNTENETLPTTPTCGTGHFLDVVSHPANPTADTTLKRSFCTMTERCRGQYEACSHTEAVT